MDLFKKYEGWSWARIQRHILYWSLWSLFFIVVNSWVGWAIEGKTYSPTPLQWTLFEGVVLPIKLASTYTIAYLLMPKFLFNRKYVEFILLSLTVTLTFASILFLAYSHIVYPLVLESNEMYTANQFIYKGLELIYIASLVVAIKFFQNYLNEEQRSQALAQQKIETELKYLKNQIQPHFLFNTLNNIYEMVLSNNSNAAETIVKLSDLMSYMLYESNEKTTSLGKEINHLEGFIELELLRYQRKLDFNFEKGNIQPSLPIAPLLLIPLVENAFKHGPAQSDALSYIMIRAETKEERLFFSVENSFSEIDNSGNLQSGIGLENIVKRLQLLYPNRHNLIIEKSSLFRVSLTIDLAE